MTPAGIESATFRFVAQHLNHCATAVPPQSSVLLKTLTGPQLVKKSPPPSRGFITAFTTAHQLSLSWARSIQSVPYPNSWRSISDYIQTNPLSNVCVTFGSDLLTCSFSSSKSVCQRLAIHVSLLTFWNFGFAMLSRWFQSGGWVVGEIEGRARGWCAGDVSVAPSGISKTSYYE